MGVLVSIHAHRIVLGWGVAGYVVREMKGEWGLADLVVISSSSSTLGLVSGL